MKAFQEQLPVFQHKDAFSKAFLNPDKLVTVVIGETGSGKTTQIPQFVDEMCRTKYDMVFPNSSFNSKKKKQNLIAVTQPRRVAAISVAQRVADEMECKLGSQIGYQVRFDEKFSDATRIKFVTDGLLVRESLQDPCLNKYSVIIIDEAHERSIDSDIALGIIRDLVCEHPLHYGSNLSIHSHLGSSAPQSNEALVKKSATQGCRRSDMRIVIMSATLADPRKFVDFFGGPSHVTVLGIPGRTFPVTTMFLSAEEEDMREAIALATTQLHLELPPGDILVFLSGQEDIHSIGHALEGVNTRIVEARLQKRRREDEMRIKETELLAEKSSSNKKLKMLEVENVKVVDTELQIEEIINDQSAPKHLQETNKNRKSNKRSVLYDASAHVAANSLISSDNHISKGERTDSLIFDAINKREAAKLQSLGGPVGLGADVKRDSGLTMLIVPLYASLSLENQKNIFIPTPAGCRKIVLCTNIAETSVTVPGVRYVIDSGREKVKLASVSSGIDCLKEHWISKSSAKQRGGRAGREAPGMVFRMYTESCFSKTMQDAPIPELQRVALDSILLTLLSIGKHPAQFAYMDAPRKDAFIAAAKKLKDLGALDRQFTLTETGRKLAQLPLAPIFGKMLLESVSLSCVKEVLTLVAMQAEGTVWFAAGASTGSQDPSAIQQQESLQRARRAVTDVSSDHLTLIKLFDTWEAARDKASFASEIKVSHAALVRAQRVRQQLLNVLQKNLGLNSISSCGQDRTPVRRVLAHSLVLQSASMKSNMMGGVTGGVGANGIGAARSYVTHVHKQEARIHPSSVLFSSKRSAELVVFGELLETKSAPNLVTVTAIEREWLEETNLYVSTQQK